MFEGWNLIKFAAEIGKKTREITQLAADLGTAEGQLARGLTFPDQAARIAELRRALQDARNTVRAMERARKALAATQTALTTTATEETALATTQSVGLGARALQAFNTLGSWVGLEGTAATVAGGAAVVGGAIIGAILIGRLVGLMSADAPVGVTAKGDPATRRAQGTLAQRPPTVRPGGAAGHYYIYVLEISGGSVWIGQEETLRHTYSCNFAGGGLCKNDGTDQPPTIRYRSGKFATLDAATRAWCQELSGKPTAYWQVAGDSKAAVYGGNYWLGLAPRCG
jgi:hypothetical protein